MRTPITAALLMAATFAAAQEPVDRWVRPSGQATETTETAYMPVGDIDGDGYGDALYGFVSYDVTPAGQGDVLEFVPEESGAYVKWGGDGTWSPFPLDGTEGTTVIDFRMVEEDGVPGKEIYAKFRSASGDYWGAEPLWKAPPGNQQAVFGLEGIHPGHSSHEYSGLFRVDTTRDVQWYIDNGVAMPQLCIRTRAPHQPVPMIVGCWQVGDGVATMSGSVISVSTPWRTNAGWRQWQAYTGSVSESVWHPMYSLGLASNVADLDGDGYIGFSDLGIFRRNFGWVSPELGEPLPPMPSSFE
jgi:hypothetical protein